MTTATAEPTTHAADTGHGVQCRGCGNVVYEIAGSSERPKAIRTAGGLIYREVPVRCQKCGKVNVFRPAKEPQVRSWKLARE